MLEGQSGHQVAVGGRTACQIPFGPRMEGVYTEASEDLASGVDIGLGGAPPALAIQNFMALGSVRGLLPKVTYPESFRLPESSKRNDKDGWGTDSGTRFVNFQS